MIDYNNIFVDMVDRVCNIPHCYRRFFFFIEDVYYDDILFGFLGGGGGGGNFNIL